jgi:hypothetical protein
MVLGWFRVIAHTPGKLGLGQPFGGSSDSPPIVSSLVTCDQIEKFMDPINQGIIGLGEYGLDPCNVIIDPFEVPCCLPDNTCLPGTDPGCCWAQGGRLLAYLDTCTKCKTPVLFKTWGQIKSRYE